MIPDVHAIPDRAGAEECEIGWLPPPLLPIWRRVCGLLQTVDDALRLLRDKDVFDWKYDDHHQPFDWEPDDDEPVVYWRSEVLAPSAGLPN